MAKKCGKCDPHEICEECPEWIFTMADLIMCMMGLFVLLWVLKPSPTPPPMGHDGEPNKQQQKLVEQIGEIRAAFGYVPDPNSADPVDQAMVQKTMRLLGENKAGRQEDPQTPAEGPDPTVQNIRESKLSIVGTRVLFAHGEAALDDDDKRTLNQIAKQLVGIRLITIVKGHASRDDFENATPQQLMDISIRRAQAASDYLESRGVSPDILRVQGCSTFEPVRQQAYSAELKEQNRRVEVFTTDLIVHDLQDPRATSMLPVD